jgi:proton-dependent oligopeptide transporter, POT family
VPARRTYESTGASAKLSASRQSYFDTIAGLGAGCEFQTVSVKELLLSFDQRLREIRTGFEPAFWVANFTEIFERVAYYATTAVLAIYLSEQLHFSIGLTASLMSIFGFVVWFLPILGGTLADRFGFRRALMFAYLVMTIGYFLLGSLSASWMEPLRRAVSDKWLVLAILMIPALGPGLVKPCVAGTTARASNENVRSMGYAIYYTLVNIGGTLGPSIAFFVRKQLGWGIENVFRIAAGSVFLMFWVTLLFFREPSRVVEEKVGSVLSAISNMFVVLANIRFLLFLAIVSGFYIVFWQIYIGMPLFVRGFVNHDAGVDATISVEAFTVICCQVLVTYLTRKLPTFRAIAIGILVTALSWLILALPIPAGEATLHLGFATLTFYRVTLYVAAVLFVLALGEVTLSARYYDYISRLAPPGQQGLYMGYAFLPVAIGYLIAGPVAGYLLHQFGDVLHRPQQMWWCVSGIGVLAAILMVVYDKIVKPGKESVAS